MKKPIISTGFKVYGAVAMFRANVIGDAFSAAASSKYHLSVKPWLMDKIYRATNLQLNLIAFMAPYDAQTMVSVQRRPY